MKKIFYVLIAIALIGIGVIFARVNRSAENTSSEIISIDQKTPDTNTTPDASGSESEPFKPQPDYTKLVLINAPFTSQAPLGQWSDERFQDGCEEASIIMAMAWVEGRSLTPEGVTKEIIDLSAYEDQYFDGNLDLEPKDVARLIRDYYKHPSVEVVEGITTEDIAYELYQGNVVLVPLDGKKLNNPNFSGGGPERHMALVIGYDPSENEFIIHDPGTRKGSKYRYTREVLERSLRTYPSGTHAPIISLPDAMVVVSK